jgi:hypothetical protein
VFIDIFDTVFKIVSFSFQISRTRGVTNTLDAHLVTLLPSFKQSISPFPRLSVLHCIKSSLYGRQRAPMKKLADSRGAEEAPTSFTTGISSGRGVVSMRVVRLKLFRSVMNLEHCRQSFQRADNELHEHSKGRLHTVADVQTWLRCFRGADRMVESAMADVHEVSSGAQA